MMTSKYIEAYSSGSGPGIYFNVSGLNSGQVRYNPNMQSLEVFDGSSWRRWIMNHEIQVTLTEEATEVMDWAIKKMSEEKKLKEKLDRYPGLRQLHEQFEIMKALCSDDNGTR